MEFKNGNIIRKARIKDAQDIYNLISYYAQRNDMLPRSMNEIYENIRDFAIMEDGSNAIFGCCGLHIFWEDLAEIKALAVREDYKLQGYGKALVEYCIEDAKNLGIRRVFTLTYKKDFFLKNNFILISKDDLPKKIWGECVKCCNFPNCEEEALMLLI